MRPRAAAKRASASRGYFRLATGTCQFPHRTLPRFGKSGKNRAIRPGISVVSFGQIKQGAPHCFERGCFAREVFGMLQRVVRYFDSGGYGN